MFALAHLRSHGQPCRRAPSAQKKPGERAVSRILLPFPKDGPAAIYLGRSVAGRLQGGLPGAYLLSEIGAGHSRSPLFGLAPGGVYRASRVTTRAVRSYRTVSPLPDPAIARSDGGPSAVCSLWHFPWPCGRWALPTTVPFGVRTFLPALPGRAAASPARRTPLCIIPQQTGRKGQSGFFSAPASFCV